MVVKMLFGSHLYGTATENSDRDYKGVFLPSGEDILLQKANSHISESTGKDNAKNTNQDVDLEMFSLQKFLDLAYKGETVAIDMLHAPKSMLIRGSDLWDELQANRSKFYCKNMRAYLGYVRKQAAKYGVKGSRLSVVEEAIKIGKHGLNNGTGSKPFILLDIFHLLPIGEHSSFVEHDHPSTGKQYFYEIVGRKFQSTLKIPMFINALEKIYDNYGHRAQQAKDNEGIDWKAISHALRAGYQLRGIYRDGGFEYPLNESDFLLKVKKGELDYMSVVQPALEELVDEVQGLADNSSLPEKPDKEWVDSIIIRVHKDIVMEK